MKITSAEFVISAFEPSQLPRDNLPEIAFAGRSNVGKSSLLNCLAGRKMAKISGTPGKTRAINFFLINRKYYFVDLPGYGYARVAKDMRKNWQKLIEDYFTGRKNLRAAILIIDGRREPVPDTDIQMLEYLSALEIPCVPVLTKVDKLNRSERVRVEKSFSGRFPELDPIFFSAVTREGLSELRGRIEDCLT